MTNTAAVHTTDVDIKVSLELPIVINYVWMNATSPSYDNQWTVIQRARRRERKVRGESLRYDKCHFYKCNNFRR